MGFDVGFDFRNRRDIGIVLQASEIFVESRLRDNAERRPRPRDVGIDATSINVVVRRQIGEALARIGRIREAEEIAAQAGPWNRDARGARDAQLFARRNVAVVLPAVNIEQDIEVLADEPYLVA